MGIILNLDTTFTDDTLAYEMTTDELAKLFLAKKHALQRNTPTIIGFNVKQTTILPMLLLSS